MSNHIRQFINKLNHLLYNIDTPFACPLTFCICSMSPNSKGTNPQWQNFWFPLVNPPLQHQDPLIVFLNAQSWNIIISVGRFDNCWIFILQMMTLLNVTITYVNTNFLKDVTNLLFKDIVPSRRWYSNHF